MGLELRNIDKNHHLFLKCLPNWLLHTAPFFFFFFFDKLAEMHRIRFHGNLLKNLGSTCRWSTACRSSNFEECNGLDKQRYTLSALFSPNEAWFTCHGWSMSLHASSNNLAIKAGLMENVSQGGLVLSITVCCQFSSIPTWGFAKNPASVILGSIDCVLPCCCCHWVQRKSRFKAFQLFQEVPGIQCFFDVSLHALRSPFQASNHYLQVAFKLHEFSFPSLVGYMYKAGSNSRHTVQITSRQN